MAGIGIVMGKNIQNQTWWSVVKEEVLCHFPYALFSVVLSMIILGFFTPGIDPKYAHRLFHGFHFLHLLFAGTGVVITFRRYSQSILPMLLVGFFVPAVFCTLSDAAIPYLGGSIFSLSMKFHWCFIKHKFTVLTFLSMGVINGYIMSTHLKRRALFFSTGSHFLHIFISSMASILYLVSFGFTQWWHAIGTVFIFLIGAVLLPCTFSDIVVPVLFATGRKNNGKRTEIECCHKEMQEDDEKHSR